MTTEEWKVRTTDAGRSIHVYPGKGMTMVQNWRFWRGEYAASARRLAHLKRACQKWCERENDRERRIERLQSG